MKDHKIYCQISLGELIDKITILELKSERIDDQNKVKLAQKEQIILRETLSELNLSSELENRWLTSLKNINAKLWEIEDKLRLKEAEKSFDKEFVELARAVYLTNDSRFEVKNEINQTFGSEIREVKSYQKY